MPKTGEPLRQEDAERLRDLLNLVYPGHPAQIQRALAYIETGDDPEVLLAFEYKEMTFGKLEEIGKKLRKDTARDFATKLVLSDPGVARRIGEVFMYLPWQMGIAASPPLLAPENILWLNAFLRVTDHLLQMRYTTGAWPRVQFPLGLLVAAAVEDGQGESSVAAYLVGAAWKVRNRAQSMMPFGAFPDFIPFLIKHRAIVRNYLDGPETSVVMYNILITGNDATLREAFAREFVEGSLHKDAFTRDKCTAIVATLPVALLMPLLVELGSTWPAAERKHALKLMVRFCAADPEFRPFLERRLRQERSETIKELLQRQLGAAAGEASAPTSETTPAEPVHEPLKAWEAIIPEPLPPLEAPTLPESVLEPLRAILAERDQAAHAHYEKYKGEMYGPKEPFKQLAPKAEEIFRLLQQPENLKAFALPEIKQMGPTTHLEKLGRLPEMGLHHVFQLAALIYNASDVHGLLTQGSFAGPWVAHHEPVNLRYMAQVLERLGHHPVFLGQLYLENPMSWHQVEYFETLTEEPWKFFATCPRVFFRCLGVANPYFPNDYGAYVGEAARYGAFRMLATMPALPPAITPYLWEVALGSSKKERPLAQAALRSEPGKVPNIIGALASGKQEVRASAALWLAELAAKEAIEPLKTALAKEKNEVAKGGMFEALDRLGVPIAQFLDRAKLEKEARAGTAKGLPKEIDWLPLAALPPVRWADNGAVVPPVILQHFITQATKLKSPEPPALIRKYCEFLHPEDRAALGKYLLLAWLAQDTAPRYTAEEAAMEATSVTARVKAQVAKYPQYYQDWDETATYRSYYNHYLNQCQGSAIASKGLLGICGCCCTGEVAAPVYAFIKKWFGHRQPQCKALLAVLAQIPDRAATQVLLTVGNRFRTKGIQEEARLQAQNLAEREGWTLDELADRTIPTAGFDEEGRQELDYGPRQFLATLTESGEIRLEHAAGKELKALPDPAQADDAALAKEARKAFSEAKKELKEVLKLQQERLYEALCTQRAWKFADWETYLNRHPILGLYCQRLAWRVVMDPHDPAAPTFRPLADRTLTDFQDEPVSVPEDAVVALAHQSVVTPEIAAGWLAHWRDYGIAPLLAQFGREQYELSAQNAEAREVAQFQGHMLEAFTLRGQATKLGYVRAAAEDGGMFHEYLKEFPTSRIRAVIGFTGNTLPEENVRTALTYLKFERMPAPGAAGNNAGRWSARALPLKDVPPVLLGECWNDIRQIAAAGPGFDADWEKKAQYA
jgi:hypothetical protein